MSIIIDTNCFANVFDISSDRHIDFAPVLKWINDGPAVLIYGGTKFINELKNGKYRRLFIEYGKSHKAYEIKRSLVDDAQDIISRLETSNDFDDQHIVALLRVSKCKILVTCDSRSHKYVKNKKFYLEHQSVPKIYSSVKNRRLLNQNNIIEIDNSIIARQ